MTDGEILVEGAQETVDEVVEADVPVMNPHAQVCLQHLLRVWLGFERDLSTVPLLRRLDLGTYTVEDLSLIHI